jgi:hypothetical protein
MSFDSWWHEHGEYVSKNSTPRNAMESAWLARGEEIEKMLRAEGPRVISEHTTNYVSSPWEKWLWSCRCGEEVTFTNREECVANTQQHWANALADRIREENSK